MATTMTDELVTAARRAGETNGVEAAVLLAVAIVETNAVAYAVFGARCEPLIRFEGHYFDRLLSATDRAEARRLGLSAAKAGAIRNPAAQSARWRLLERAAAIDAAAAYASTSWGIGQVMGAHWKVLGFANAEALAAEARRSVEGQFSIVARFLKNEELDRLLSAGAFAAFARRYNGPGYARNRYDAKIQAAYAAAGKRLKEMERHVDTDSEDVTLVEGARGAAVTKLQRDLARHGFAVVADGIFGPRTRAALSSFRRSKGLEAKPLADAKTLVLLAEEVGAAREIVSKGWLTPPAMLSTPLSWLSNLPPSAPTPMRSSSISMERSSASPTIPPTSGSRPPPAIG